ncbi:MAG: class I SAM-dependent RNA methyltransferase [Pseudomonadales bacterium]|nr:class I SAM-dependent RNA methyltransferase [Pseudomonadales bacterium]
MDPLGQGVSKLGDKAVFIAKTLPGESGVAEVTRQTKGVQFGRVQELTGPASNRVEPACVHFNRCPGCHYLHTDYESELVYKQQTLLRYLARFPAVEAHLRVYPAMSRLSYRNRIQLHYRYHYLGLIDGVSDQVVEIPHCKILHPSLTEAFQQLYSDKSWAETHKGRGHCELYLCNDEVRESWNQPYAEGGFTQVNQAMNQLLRTVVAECVEAGAGQVETLLDLFAGDGNLSAEIPVKKTQVDCVASSKHAEAGASRFVALDLFQDDALNTFRSQCPEKKFDVLLVDPPRKGFPVLDDWVKAYKPGQLVYVSCNAATMARDLESLSGRFTVEKVALIDLFPGTYHFETLVSLRFKNK